MFNHTHYILSLVPALPIDKAHTLVGLSIGLVCDLLVVLILYGENPKLYQDHFISSVFSLFNHIWLLSINSGHEYT